MSIKQCYYSNNIRKIKKVFNCIEFCYDICNLRIIIFESTEFLYLVILKCYQLTTSPCGFGTSYLVRIFCFHQLFLAISYRN